jgi:hypothetical protein
MSAIAADFEEDGHEVTHKWWLTEDIPEGAGKHLDTLKKQAQLDVRGVRTADCVILINSAKSEGKAVEQGLAIAYAIPIIAVGVRGVLSKNVFHYLDDYYWVSSVADAVKLLKQSELWL